MLESGIIKPVIESIIEPKDSISIEREEEEEEEEVKVEE
jgi:hypothetical protein